MKKIRFQTVIPIIAVLVCTFLITGTTLAAFSGSGTGYITGYAMLDIKGTEGREIIQGHAATHGYSYCPNDMASKFNWGTKITFSSFISYHTQNGGMTYNSVFYKYDNGDMSCGMGNYWIDTYHGRYKPASDSCICDNYLGTCYSGTNNSCTDALNTGQKWWTYRYDSP